MGQTSSIIMLSVVGIIHCVPAVDKKMQCFLVCFFVTISNYEVCENLNGIKDCNLKKQLWKVSSCAPIFKFFYGPQDFPFRANLYQKLPILAIWGLWTPFLVPQWWNLAWLCVPGTPSTIQFFLKNQLRGFAPLGRIGTDCCSTRTHRLQCPSRWEAIDKISDHIRVQTRLCAGSGPILHRDWLDFVSHGCQSGH